MKVQSTNHDLLFWSAVIYVKEVICALLSTDWYSIISGALASAKAQKDDGSLRNYGDCTTVLCALTQVKLSSKGESSQSSSRIMAKAIATCRGQLSTGVNLLQISIPRRIPARVGVSHFQ